MTASRGAGSRRSRHAAASIALVATLAVACADGDGDPRPAARSPDAGADVAAPTPAERACIERLAQAEGTVESTGWKTVVQGPPGSSRETRLRVTRWADGRTRLAWEGSGDGASLRWDSRGRAPWAQRVDLVLRNYRVVEDERPGPTVAWRATRRVRFLPRRADRPSLELLADAETGLVLAETHRSASGEEFFASRYESIEFGPPPETATADGDGAAHAAAAAEVVPRGREPGRAESAPWTPLRVATLPGGFVPVGDAPGAPGVRGAGVPGGDDVRREDFTDGVAVLSVVQRPARTSGPPPDAPPPGGDCRRRAWRGGGSLEGVVLGVEVRISGTLPPPVLQTVLAGLERPPAPVR